MLKTWPLEDQWQIEYVAGCDSINKMPETYRDTSQLNNIGINFVYEEIRFRYNLFTFHMYPDHDVCTFSQSP